MWEGFIEGKWNFGKLINRKDVIIVTVISTMNVKDWNQHREITPSFALFLYNTYMRKDSNFPITCGCSIPSPLHYLQLSTLLYYFTTESCWLMSLKVLRLRLEGF